MEIEIGGLFTLEEMSLLRTVLQKLESVLLERNLKSLTSKWRYKFLDLVSLLLECWILPLAIRSIPIVYCFLFIFNN